MLQPTLLFALPSYYSKYHFQNGQWTPVTVLTPIPQYSEILERGKNLHASAGSRTRINCLEGNYANRYTTDADEKHTCQYMQSSPLAVHPFTLHIQELSGIPAIKISCWKNCLNPFLFAHNFLAINSQADYNDILYFPLLLHEPG